MYEEGKKTLGIDRIRYLPKYPSMASHAVYSWIKYTKMGNLIR